MNSSTSNRPKGIVNSGMKIFHFPEKLRSLPRERGELLPPIHVRIKPTNICNHDCWFCAYSQEDFQLGETMVERDQIPFDKMMEIVDDLVEMKVEAVTFSGGGEPLVHPYLLQTVERLAEHGIRFDARLVTGTSFGKESGRAGVRSLLDSGIEFTALFAFSNLVGIGALESLLESGIKVPADVSLVSFDEQPYSGVLAVPMTTVRQDPAEIGRLAIEMLCRRIENPAEQPPASVVVPTTLVPRDSVATLRAP